ncbi:MAG: DUF3325 family protein [Pseudomonadota bacterium]
MLPGLLLLSTLVLSVLGCACLALSQQHHWRSVMGQQITANISKRARIVGCCCVFAALLISFFRGGFGFAVAMWPLSLALGVVLVALALGMRRNILRRIGAGLRIPDR